MALSRYHSRRVFDPKKHLSPTASTALEDQFEPIKFHVIPFAYILGSDSDTASESLLLLFQSPTDTATHQIGGAFITGKLSKNVLQEKLKINSPQSIEERIAFNLAENIKINLSEFECANGSYISPNGEEIMISINRSEFESLIHDIVIEITDVASRALGSFEVDWIELFGGSSRIQKVLKSFFKGKELKMSFDSIDVLTLRALGSTNQSVPRIRRLFSISKMLVSHDVNGIRPVFVNIVVNYFSWKK
jgi:molecular chaperone DnaK (HSP70)